MYTFRIYAENQIGRGPGLILQTPIRISSETGKIYKID